MIPLAKRSNAEIQANYRRIRAAGISAKDARRARYWKPENINNFILLQTAGNSKAYTDMEIGANGEAVAVEHLVKSGYIVKRYGANNPGFDLEATLYGGGDGDRAALYLFEVKASILPTDHFYMSPAQFKFMHGNFGTYRIIWINGFDKIIILDDLERLFKENLLKIEHLDNIKTYIVHANKQWLRETHGVNI